MNENERVILRDVRKSGWYVEEGVACPVERRRRRDISAELLNIAVGVLIDRPH